MTEKQKPDTRDAAIDRQGKALEIMRDVYGGTLAVRAKGEKYLPKMEMEERKDYARRLAIAVLYNATRRTVGGLVGMVFRKDPALDDDVPAPLKGDAENIDHAGRHLAVFARDHFTDAYTDGHACILVDMPAVEPGAAQTLADERELAGRPYWVNIRKGQILRVRTMNVAGRVVLSRFAYTETATEEDGEFGQREVERVRDYMLLPTKDGVRCHYRIWSKRKESDGREDWKEDTSGWTPMSIGRVPVVFTYTGRTAYAESTPPLLDLALENILHYQTRADRQNVLRIASVPVPVFVGLAASDIEWGADRAVFIPNKEGSASYLEVQGASLVESREELRDIERRMATLGLSQLMSETRAAETATSKRIDKSESDSQLASAARNLQDALELAMQIHAEWRGVEGGGSIAVNMEFGELTLDAQTAKVLHDMVMAGDLTVESLWDAMVRGNVLPEDFNADRERELLDSEGMRAPALDIAA
jgi:hypothetical protein